MCELFYRKCQSAKHVNEGAKKSFYSTGKILILQRSISILLLLLQLSSFIYTASRIKQHRPIHLIKKRKSFSNVTFSVQCIFIEGKPAYNTVKTIGRKRNLDGKAVTIGRGDGTFKERNLVYKTFSY